MSGCIWRVANKMCMPVYLCLSQKPATRRPDHKYWRTLALQSAFQANQHKLKQDGLAYPELARSSSDSETLLLDLVSSTYGQTLEYRIGRDDLMLPPARQSTRLSVSSSTHTWSHCLSQKLVKIFSTCCASRGTSYRC